MENCISKELRTGRPFDAAGEKVRRISLIVCFTLFCVLFPAILTGCADKENEISLDRALVSGQETQQSVSAAEQQPQEETKEPAICVYVCGEVCSPGVVELPAGSRAEAAVLLAGGLTQEADRNYVNLAALVTDGEKLYIPSVLEAAELEAAAEDEECGLVNINTADRDRLLTLPGIGESRAQDIISYREKNGDFASIEDIMKVPGIKSAAFEKIKEKITV